MNLTETPTLHVLCGCMSSGKSTKSIMLANQARLFGKTVYLRLSIDVRQPIREIECSSRDTIKLHESVKSFEISNEWDFMTIPTRIHNHEFANILVEYRFVFIDEIHFLEQKKTHKIMYFLKNNISVCVSGLDMDFRGQSFQTTSDLLAKADTIEKLHAVCDVCNKKEAVFSDKITGNKDDRLDMNAVYLSVCRSCYRGGRHE